MTDDIVTRLRGYGEGVWCICGARSNYYCSCDPFDTITARAADEIERLRADRDKWRGLAERAMELLEDANRILAGIQQAVNND